MKISERLHRAADTKLQVNGRFVFSKREYSCDAVAHVDVWDYDGDCAEFLYDLGVSCMSTSEFDEFPEGRERQGARYLWLKFAALVAESEGL